MLKILPFLLIMSIASHAIVESQIQPVMNKKVHQVLNILKNTTLTQKQKDQQSIMIMDSVFDYNIMAKISLGKRWRTLYKKKKKAFTQVFEHKIKHSYVDKLRLYSNQKVLIKTLRKVKSTRISLETQVIGKTDTYKVMYLFYKNKQNQWFIYDVRLAGVSIIQTYRKQFKAFLKTKTFKQLLNSL